MIPDVSDKLLKYLDQYYKKDHHLKANTILRIAKTVYPISTYFSFKGKKYATVVLSARKDDVKVNYGYVYFFNNTPEYICIGYSYYSSDGEYRCIIMSFEQLCNVFENFSKEFDNIEYVADKVINKDKLIELSAEYIEPFGEDYKRSEIENYIAKSRLPMQIFMVSIVHVNSQNNEKKLEHHMNEKFKILIEPFIALKILHIPRDMGVSITRINYHNDIHASLICGQKITPLTVADFENFGSINRPVWKELYCNNAMGDLMINSVFSGISMPCGWFIVKNTKSLYDNEAMYNKIHQSNVYKETVKDLRKLQKTTQEIFAEAINQPIEVAENNIILSPYAIVTVSEYVGRTLADYLYHYHWLSKASGLLFDDCSIFDRYLFDIIYGLFCCNSIIGTMHGDLHLNNCTIFMQIYFPYKGELILYDLRELNKNYYLFKHFGGYSCLIDFSRAILSPEKTDNGVEVMKDEILKLYERNFPEFYASHKINLEILSLQSPSDVFNIVSAYDVHSVCSKLYFQLTTNKLIKASKEVLDRLKEVVNMSKDHLTNRMLKYISDSSYKPENSNKLMIDALFTPYIYSYNSKKDPNDKHIIDLSTYTSKLKYSLSSYETLPVYLQEIKTYEDKKVKTIITANEMRALKNADAARYNKFEKEVHEILEQMPDKYKFIETENPKAHLVSSI